MKKEQLAHCYELWKSCFGDSSRYMDYYFEEKCRDNHILTLYEGDILTSMVHLNPYRIQFDRTETGADYIVGVATDPAYRKQGRMAALLKEAFQEMYEDGKGFTYLMPADQRIYTPFDFSFIYTQDRAAAGKYKRNMEHEQVCAAEKRRTCRMVSTENTDGKIWNAAAEFVNGKLKENFSVYTIRSADYYKRLQKEMKAAGGSVLVFFCEDAITGVLAYMKENSKIEIAEAVLETEETADIWELFADSVFSEEGIEAETEFLETYFLDKTVLEEQFETVEWKKKPIIMARIIRLEAFVPMTASLREDSKKIRITDRFIEGNNGTWNIFFSKEGNRIARTEEPFDMEMSISEFMTEIMGNKKVYINEIV